MIQACQLQLRNSTLTMLSPPDSFVPFQRASLRATRNSRNEIKTTIRSCIWTLAVVVDKVNYKLCTSVAHETSWPKFHLGTRLKVATIQDVSSSFVGLISSVAYMDRLPLYGLWASAGLIEIMIP